MPPTTVQFTENFRPSTWLGNLPSEILLDTFSRLTPVELVPVASVNRRFHALATPLVYRGLIADPNIFAKRPLATEVPPDKQIFVKHLHLWGQHPDSGKKAFRDCPNIERVTWDLGVDAINLADFTKTNFPAELNLMMEEMRFEHMLGFSIDMDKDLTRFRYSLGEFVNLKTLIIRPLLRLYQGGACYNPNPPLFYGGLFKTIDLAVGNSLEHLVIERSEPRLSLSSEGSTFRNPGSFQKLKTISIPFSSRLFEDPLPSRNILRDAFQLSRVRKIKFIHIELDEPKTGDPRYHPAQVQSFAPLIEDFVGLKNEELLDFYEWVAETFPSWNYEFLFVNVGSRKDLDMDEIAGVFSQLRFLGLPFGIRLFGRASPLKSARRRSVISFFNRFAKDLVSLTIEIRHSGTKYSNKFLSEDEEQGHGDKWIFWLADFLHRCSNLVHFGIINRKVRDFYGEYPVGPWHSPSFPRDALGKMIQGLDRGGALRQVSLSLGHIERFGGEEIGAGFGRALFLEKCLSLTHLTLLNAHIESLESLELLWSIIRCLRRLKFFELQAWMRMTGEKEIRDAFLIPARSPTEEWKSTSTLRSDAESSLKNGIQRRLFQELGSERKDDVVVVLKLQFLWVEALPGRHGQYYYSYM